MDNFWARNIQVMVDIMAVLFGLLMLISLISLLRVVWQLLRRLFRRPQQSSDTAFLD